MDHEQPGTPGTPSFWRSPAGVGLVVTLAIVAFYLATEHSAHLLGALPYLLFLACPLMHVFMHGGHHGGDLGRGTSHGEGTHDESARH